MAASWAVMRLSTGWWNVLEERRTSTPLRVRRWLAKKLTPLPVEQQSDNLRVRGCVSQVFVRGELQQGVMHWQGDSDALIAWTAGVSDRRAEWTDRDRSERSTPASSKPQDCRRPDPVARQRLPEHPPMMQTQAAALDRLHRSH